MSKSFTLEERKAIVERMSWVKRHRESPQQCDGVVISKMKAKHWHGTPEEQAQRPRCKRDGYWRFKASKESWARDGVYCWQHLMWQGLYYDMGEEARTERWLKKHGYL